MSRAGAARSGLRRAVLAALLAPATLLLAGGPGVHADTMTPAAALDAARAGAHDAPRAAAPAAGPAVAPAVYVPEEQGGQLMCPGGSDPKVIDQSLLPANRWASASSQMHSRLDADMWNDVWSKMQRHGTDSIYMNIGNSAWSAGASITEFASRFCLTEQVGHVTDQAAAAIGRALIGQDEHGDTTTGPIIPMLLVAVAIGTVLWRRSRGRGGSWGPLVRSLVIIALFAAMLAGASRTTGYRFGTMSPGWLSSKANGVISGLANAPAMALEGSVGELSGYAVKDDSDRLSCGNYLYTLREKYKAGYAAFGSAAAVPMMLDSMWQQAGLSTYIQTQFGPSQPTATGRTGERVYCHQLEYNAGTSPKEHMDYARVRAPGLPANEHAQPWSPADNSGVDRAIMSFAACQSRGPDEWALDPAFATQRNPFQADAPPTTTECRDTFRVDDATAGNESMWFNWEDDGPQIIQATAGNPDARTFILTYHGNENHSSAGFMYALVSLAILAVFAVLAMAIIAAKVGMQVMILLVFLAMIASLVKRDDSAGPLVKYLKTYLGMAIFAFGASLVLALVAMISRIIIEAGRSFGASGGSTLTVIWTGVGPIIAIFLVKLVFTDLFKAPNPFKLSSGLAYASLAGGAGFAVGRGLDRLGDRAKGQARRVGTSSARRAGSVGASRTGPARSSRIGGMEPSAGRKFGGGSGGPAAAAGAVGGLGAMLGRRKDLRATPGQPGQAAAQAGPTSQAGQRTERTERVDALDAARARTDQAEDALHAHDLALDEQLNPLDTAAGHRRRESEQARAGRQLHREQVGGRVEHTHTDRVANTAVMAGRSVRDSVANVGYAFRDRPLASTGKVAAVAGVAVLAPFAAPAVAAGVGGLWAVNKARSGRSRTARQQARAEHTDIYLRHRKRQRLEYERSVLLAEREEQKAADDVWLADGPAPQQPDGNSESGEQGQR